MSITSASSLNTTGVAEITEKTLVDLFQTDADKFFKFVDKNIALFDEDLISNYYSVELECVHEATLRKLEELAHIVSSINCDRRFIRGAQGLNADDVEDKLVARKLRLAELTDKFDVLVTKFQDRARKEDAKPDAENESLGLRQHTLDPASEPPVNTGTPAAPQETAEEAAAKEAAAKEAAAKEVVNKEVALEEDVNEQYKVNLPVDNRVTTMEIDEDILRQRTAARAASTPVASEGAKRNLCFSTTVDKCIITADESGIRSPSGSVINSRYVRRQSGLENDQSTARSQGGQPRPQPQGHPQPRVAQPQGHPQPRVAQPQGHPQPRVAQPQAHPLPRVSQSSQDMRVSQSYLPATGSKPDDTVNPTVRIFLSYQSARIRCFKNS